MTDEAWYMFEIIHYISSRKEIISVTIRGSRDGGTSYVVILIIIIAVFRISTRVVITVGIIINIIFGIVIIVDGNIVAEAKAPLAIVIFCFVFGCRIRLASGVGTVIIRLRRIMIVALEIIINVVFGIVIAVVVENLQYNFIWMADKTWS